MNTKNLNFDKNRTIECTTSILALIYRIPLYISFDISFDNSANYAYTSINLGKIHRIILS